MEPKNYTNNEKEVRNYYTYTHTHAHTNLVSFGRQNYVWLCCLRSSTGLNFEAAALLLMFSALASIPRVLKLVRFLTRWFLSKTVFIVSETLKPRRPWKFFNPKGKKTEVTVFVPRCPCWQYAMSTIFQLDWFLNWISKAVQLSSPSLPWTAGKGEALFMHKTT